LKFALELELEQERVLTPYDNFLYALKAKEIKRQYPHRLDKFLSFMGFREPLKKSAPNFMILPGKMMQM
jgi:hypothetical protein